MHSVWPHARLLLHLPGLRHCLLAVGGPIRASRGPLTWHRRAPGRTFLAFEPSAWPAGGFDRRVRSRAAGMNTECPDRRRRVSALAECTCHAGTWLCPRAGQAGHRVTVITAGTVERVARGRGRAGLRRALGRSPGGGKSSWASTGPSRATRRDSADGARASPLVRLADRRSSRSLLHWIPWRVASLRGGHWSGERRAQHRPRLRTLRRPVGSRGRRPGSRTSTTSGGGTRFACQGRSATGSTKRSRWDSRSGRRDNDCKRVNSGRAERRLGMRARIVLSGFDPREFPPASDT